MTEKTTNSKKGGISVDTEHILPIIKKWLYSEKDIFLREIVSNAADAITKLRRLGSLGIREETDEQYRITVALDKAAGTITVTDNGIGMSEEELKKIIYNYGEERFSPRIAAAIVRKRSEKPIETTGELVDIIKGAIPAAAREGGHHPAKRTFQAIRIEVNGELEIIEPTIKNAVDILKPGGRIAIITFHSLEDRIVKQTFADLASGCTCPRSFPVCVCGKKPTVKVISKKPILPSAEELEVNPRSRSAKLRIAEKI